MNTRKYRRKRTPLLVKLKIVLIAIAVLAVAILGARIAFYYHQHPSYDLSAVPEFSDEPSVRIDNGKPAFTDKQIDKVRKAVGIGKSSTSSGAGQTNYKRYEKFASLDGLGRCGQAVACVGRETMPGGERGPIGMVRPSGWKIRKYDFIDNGGYLYNRCHLIGWQLTGVNADERNLITGTRYMNTEGMLPYENEIASYVRRTGNHVLYRVAPVFKGNELVARGVHMEALSLEDRGRGVSFNVYCYNAQPGVVIDYRSGGSEAK